MFWNDYSLTAWAQSGGISPLDLACINPASIDLRWSGRYRVATPGGWSDTMTAETLTLMRGDFYLLDTLETVSVPLNAVGWLALKSSMGRRGLEHLHAGFFDPGFYGTATLEIENRAPWQIVITRGQRIIQLALADCAVPAQSYRVTGRYNGQSEPQPERVTA